MNWQDPNSYKFNDLVLILWGTKTSGPMGYEIGKKDDKQRWVSQHGEYIETDGFCVCGWQYLPAMD